MADIIAFLIPLLFIVILAAIGMIGYTIFKVQGARLEAGIPAKELRQRLDDLESKVGEIHKILSDVE